MSSMHILDDSNVIRQRDPQDALGFAAQQPAQLAHEFGIERKHFTGKQIDAVVFAGMGGSSLVAELVRTWPDLNVPFVISKEYRLPDFTNKNTLVICSSYSGNTEETLETLLEAQQRGSHIAVIAHGGKLAERARQHGHILAQLPEVPQPRTSVFYAYRAVIEILIAANLADESELHQLSDLVEPLTKTVQQWLPSVLYAQNYAKQLADHMVGKTPIIYGGPLMYPAAYKWKINANENAKNTAWSNFLPEFNHNEFIGWSSHPVEKPFAVVDLLSSFEHPRVQKRFEVTDRMLSGLRPKSVNVQAKGDSVLEHLLYLVLLGDFATTYLALLNGVNPTPVDLVEKFKKELGPYEPPANG